MIVTVFYDICNDPQMSMIYDYRQYTISGGRDLYLSSEGARPKQTFYLREAEASKAIQAAYKTGAGIAISLLRIPVDVNLVGYEFMDLNQEKETRFNVWFSGRMIGNVKRHSITPGKFEYSYVEYHESRRYDDTRIIEESLESALENLVILATRDEHQMCAVPNASLSKP